MRPSDFCRRVASAWFHGASGGGPMSEGQGHRARRRTGRADSALGNDDFALHLKSRPNGLGVARGATFAACSYTPLTPQDSHDFVLAVNEAVTNAIRHGSPDGPNDFLTLRCKIATGAIRVSVIDHGAGIGRGGFAIGEGVDDARACGLGLPIMRRLSDGIKIRSSSRGTTVTMAKFFSPLMRAA